MEDWDQRWGELLQQLPLALQAANLWNLHLEGLSVVMNTNTSHLDVKTETKN